MIEDFVLIEVDFKRAAEIVSTSQPPGSFFDRIVGQVKRRNPDIP